MTDGLRARIAGAVQARWTDLTLTDTWDDNCLALADAVIRELGLTEAPASWSLDDQPAPPAPSMLSCLIIRLSAVRTDLGVFLDPSSGEAVPYPQRYLLGAAVDAVKSAVKVLDHVQHDCALASGADSVAAEDITYEVSHLDGGKVTVTASHPGGCRGWAMDATVAVARHKARERLLRAKGARP